jgi:hypothetical protein
VELPPELAVNAEYGLSVLGHREAALRLALFVMSPEAQHLIGLYGSPQWRRPQLLLRNSPSLAHSQRLDKTFWNSALCNIELTVLTIASERTS